MSNEVCLEAERPTKYTGEVDWSNPNCYISQYFTVGEVTKGDPRRIPASGSPEEAQILSLANELDHVRADWGAPIGVTSWFRPPAVNEEQGGVPDSAHCLGCAADIYTMDGRDMEFESWLDANWGGGLGYGVGSGLGFTHVDIRGGGWKYGDASRRWFY